MKITTKEYITRLKIEKIFAEYSVTADKDYEVIAEEIAKIFSNHSIEFSNWIIENDYEPIASRTKWSSDMAITSYTTKELYEKFTNEG